MNLCVLGLSWSCDAYIAGEGSCLLHVGPVRRRAASPGAPAPGLSCVAAVVPERFGGLHPSAPPTGEKPDRSLRLKRCRIESGVCLSYDYTHAHGAVGLNAGLGEDAYVGEGADHDVSFVKLLLAVGRRDR